MHFNYHDNKYQIQTKIKKGVSFKCYTVVVERWFRNILLRLDLQQRRSKVLYSCIKVDYGLLS